MKNLLSFAILLIHAFSSYAQKANDNILTYTEIVKIDSAVTSKELYQRARSWFAKTYRSSQSVIQMDDKEDGKIIGKGNIRYISKILMGSEGTKGWISYTITLQVKNGRYKYEITDFYHEGNSLSAGGQVSFTLITNDEECPYKIGVMASKSWRTKVWKDIKQTITNDIVPLIESLKNELNNKSTDEETNW